MLRTASERRPRWRPGSRLGVGLSASSCMPVFGDLDQGGSHDGSVIGFNHGRGLTCLHVTAGLAAGLLLALDDENRYRGHA